MKQPPPTVFAIDKCGDDPSAFLGQTELEVMDVGEDGHVFAECDYAALAVASLERFPEGLSVRIHSSDGFGTFLFHEAVIFRGDSGELLADFMCVQPNKYWEGSWGLSTFLGAIKDQVAFFPDVSLTEIDVEDDWKRLTLRMLVGRGSAAEALNGAAIVLKKLIREAEVALAGIRWKSAYATDERAFCEEVLAPLLRRMQFLSVRYTHGVREYGRDFTFSELTRFGTIRHYGLQAKAGDVSGGVNSAIDEIVGQADDAYKMPYYDIASAEPRYISTFIVAISGRFTSNAREKIVNKVPRGVYGSLLFLDRESILELIDRHWKVS
ncbi:MAG: restriction endonuclease [Gammaproteobacteria bacterium]|nr:restriction endonuclease [Gammaproteobacteria bacterium]